MADWSTEPGLSQTWANFLAALKARDEANAKMDYSGETNIPTGTIRWNTVTNRFQRWTGAAWADLTNIPWADSSPSFASLIRVGTSPGGGYVTLQAGGAPQPGYVEFYTGDDIRRGYIGWSDGANHLQLVSEAGWNWTFSQAPLVNGTPVALTTQLLGLGSLSDPNSDRILFWDDSAGSLQWLAPSTGITISGTSMSVNEAQIGTSAATVDRVVRRDANGDIFGRYLNQSSSNSENPVISQVMVTNGSDNYFRKASLIHLENSLGTESNSASRVVRRDSLGHIRAVNFHSAAGQDSSPVGEVVYRISTADGWYRACSLTHFKRSLILNCTIQSDPGGTPAGSPGDIFFYY